MELRKHIQNMTKDDIEMLENATKNKVFKYTDYSLKRVLERNIGYSSVQETIENGQIVEFHYKDGDIRILKRSNHCNHRGHCTCVVYSLLSESIITVYRNDYSDNHITLDKSKYTDVDLQKLIKRINQN